MTHPIMVGAGGDARYWTEMPGDAYEVTGVDCNGKRFHRVCFNFRQCEGINVWRGSKWLRRDGQRYLIQRITN